MESAIFELSWGEFLVAEAELKLIRPMQSDARALKLQTVKGMKRTCL
jgi:hypothetical protein